MAKLPLKDMIILLPGVTGSILQKNGTDIWNLSLDALWQAISSGGGSLRGLEVTVPDPPLSDLAEMYQKDPNAFDDVGDGVKASGVFQDVHGLFGLVKMDGYTQTRDMILNNFEVKPGDNYFEFAYDWRRDNRLAAWRLKRLIDQKLPAWRQQSGAQDAKVILLAHSMGGLVSRYYLEVLQGWPNAKALITFGTPYRGSLLSLNFLANGYKNIIDLTSLLRSMNSAYQLMPIYRALFKDNQWVRVVETENLPGVDNARAMDARAFHLEIETAVSANRLEAGYDYQTIPIVGIGQSTLQSAKLDGAALIASEAQPDHIDALLEGGDGTVPRVSAIPIEKSSNPGAIYVGEQHGCLQCSPSVLTNLLGRIAEMQATGLSGVRSLPPRTAEPAVIGLSLDDLYLPGEAIVIQANVRGMSAGKLQAILEPVGKKSKKQHLSFKRKGEGWVLNLDDLEAGSYRIRVGSDRVGPRAPGVVTGLFQVGK